ncbi:hypothetical protein NMK71_11350 [Weeksellaceae bacterium KMM 9713]|uniref:Uncharacterized protein n=1 Tax=Profundicola chukchiensis TaxID=2961959 RepID=A0A9X4RVB6_9FLAO|nr:hypothetical protein [Profundicola chukchiensis]MDG4947008.1 hypothetical protein [Profundicola chukchiensis]
MTKNIDTKSKNSINSKAKSALEKLIRETYGKPINSVNSFKELSETTQLSVQTLRRFFGKIEKNKNVSKSTLSILCRYVGYADWDSFVTELNTEKKLDAKDKIYLESMKPFFASGEKYFVKYSKDTVSVDTLNAYVNVIYKNIENIKYFHKLYKKYNWACDYIYAWLPNYNYFGNTEFRKLLSERVKSTPSKKVKLALCNFLYFGEFLSAKKCQYTPDISVIKKHYAAYKKEYPYMPYHEMRYTSILLMDAKKENNKEAFQEILGNYLIQLEQAELSEFNKIEILIFFSNTLIWLEEFKLAYSLLKDKTSFIKDFIDQKPNKNPLHFYGINLAFVKTTFLITWVTNELPPLKDFALSDKDFKSPTGLLYKDYIRLMYLLAYILKETKSKEIEFSTQELDKLVNKTGYKRALNILK